MSPSPLTRVSRTVLQVLVAVAAIVPSVATVADTLGHPINGPALVAVVGVAVLVATTVHNVAQHAGPVPIVRTLVQIVVALAGIVPATVALLAKGGIHPDETALASIAGAAVLVATTVQNLLEHLGVIPTLGDDRKAARR